MSSPVDDGGKPESHPPEASANFTSRSANGEVQDAIEANMAEPHSKDSASRQQGIELVPIRPDEMALEPQKLRSGLKLAAILAGLNLSIFIAALDQTIVATAIPTICSDLHSASGYTWIGGAYLLANASAGTIWSKLSDIWGRKPICLAAVTFFACGSIICAVAKTMEVLIIGRALQGAASGGLLQLVMITISDLFSMRSRSLYFGLTEAMWALAGGVGPTLGGAFTEFVSWRWNFWINLPISVTAFLLLFFFLDVHNPRTRAIDGIKAIDWFGSLSILGLTVMLLLGLNFGGTTFPWGSSKVICLIIFGSLMSVVFFFSEKRLAQYPLMPLTLFSKPGTAACLLVGFFHGFVFISAEYYLPLYFQSVLTASPLRSGVLILPMIIPEALTAISTGIIIHRTGRYRELIWTGTILLTLGIGLLIHLDSTSSIAEIAGIEVLIGISSGLLFEPPLIAIQALVSQADTATTTSTFSFVRNLATSFSLVVGGVVFQNGMRLQANTLRAQGLPSDLVQEFTGGSAAANVLKVGTIQDLGQRQALKDAFAGSLKNMWILFTCAAGLGVLASAFVVITRLSREHTETRTGIQKVSESDEVRE